jgi:hypothetical protein
MEKCAANVEDMLLKMNLLNVLKRIILVQSKLKQDLNKFKK